MISDLNTEREKLEKVENEKIIMFKAVIGNCYQYKNNFKDKYLTYIKVIKSWGDSTDWVATHKFEHSQWAYDDEVVQFSESHLRLDALRNLTLITEEEFKYEVSKYLKKMELQFKQ